MIPMIDRKGGCPVTARPDESPRIDDERRARPFSGKLKPDIE